MTELNNAGSRHEPAKFRITPLVLTGLLLGTGCSHLEKTRLHAHRALDEHSRALTTAVVDTLQLQPAERRDANSTLALRLAREDQRIEGLPLKPIAVEPLLDPGSSARNAAAEASLARRFREIEKLLAREEAARQSLLDLGAKAESIQNQRRARWTKIFGSFGLLTGTVIALCVFFPLAIPLFARLLAWCVGKIPALAGTLGIVSVKAFDAVIKGIEHSKNSSSSRLANAPSLHPDPATENLHASLSRELDAAHKSLVRARKQSLSIRAN